MKFSEAFKQLRLQNKLGVNQLALMSNVDPSTVSKIEHGKRIPKPATLRKLAHGLRVPTNKLFRIAGLEPTRHYKLPFNPIDKHNMVMIPVIGDIHCGKPITANQNIQEYFPFPLKLLDKSFDYFILHCRGDSMEPKIHDGNYVLCRLTPDVENGEIAAVLVNDDCECTLKRVYKDAKHRDVELIPDNVTPENRPIILDKNHRGRVVGKVVLILSKP